MQRRSLEEQKLDLERRRGQIEARLKSISAREASAKRKADTRRKVIIGALVLGTADADTRIRQWLAGLLRGAPQRPGDAAVLAGLIAELEQPQPPAATAAVGPEEVL